MFATPSLYTIYNQPPRLDGGLVIGISQSGASPDVVSVLAEARSQGRPTLALTNAVDSPLAQAAEAVLPLEAGEEHAVAATKTYMNSLGAIALLFSEIGPDAVAREELARMPEALAAQIELSLGDAVALEEYRDAAGLTVVARGVNYGTAFEIALKIRELSGLMTEAYSPADLMHGPIAAVQPGWPVIVVAPNGPARPTVEEVFAPLKRPRSPAHRCLRRSRRPASRADAAASRSGRARVAQPADGGRAGTGDGASPHATPRARSRQPARPAQDHAHYVRVERLEADERRADQPGRRSRARPSRAGSRRASVRAPRAARSPPPARRDGRTPRPRNRRRGGRAPARRRSRTSRCRSRGIPRAPRGSPAPAPSPSFASRISRCASADGPNASRAASLAACPLTYASR